MTLNEMHLLGSGKHYLQIHAANFAQIRDRCGSAWVRFLKRRRRLSDSAALTIGSPRYRFRRTEIDAENTVRLFADS
jgi:hypothetical protein